jgi:hypothetical protein
VSAINLVLRRGRAYATGGGRYCTLQVYSTDENDMHVLVNAFGGNYYEHDEGWQWCLSKRERLYGVRVAIEHAANAYSRVRLRALFEQFPVENVRQAALA